MPWSETTAMEGRKRFVLGVLAGDFSITELCEQFGVSRPTGYKWTSRFLERGEEGLVDRSRAPLRSPYRTSRDIEEGLVAFRQQHPHWSAKKLVAILRERMPEKPWPAASTAGGILKRRGLILPRRRRTRREHPGFRPMPLQRPNQLWTSDFKGQFRLGDSSYCYPLTVADRFSRYLLGCRALRGTFHHPTQQVFQRLFREYGLPEAILTDNGCPFASPGLVRLARLSVWFIRLDIQVITIQPAHPEQNGSHERMHRTLKAETTRPPASNQPQQQLAFDRFRHEYNQLRPHESLGQVPPARLYSPSSRCYPRRLPELEYPGHFEVRRVSSNGCISWKGDSIHLTQVLVGERVGLEEVDDRIWSLNFGPKLLGRLYEATGRFVAVPS